MIAQVFDRQLTPEEYLAFEEKSEIKHEYVDGQVYAMAGTTDDHNTIAQNIQVALRTQLRGSGCQVFISDVRVQLPVRNYYHPDVFVTCDPADRENSIAKQFPKLIVEVLSDSTEAKDRGDKFIDYQLFESLEEYVLISSKRKRVEVFRRSNDGLWVLQVYQESTSAEKKVAIEIKSVGLKTNFAELYEDVNLTVADKI